MKVYIGCDHAGFELKEKAKSFLVEKGYEVEDCGAYAYNPQDDYSDFSSKVAEEVSKNPDIDRGIILAGSGEAEMMTANKFPGIRAALFYTPKVAPGAVDISGRTSDDPYEIVRLTREHNNANVLSIGARFLTEAEMYKAIEIWLTEPFSGDERHVRRINKISEIERRLCVENT